MLFCTLFEVPVAVRWLAPDALLFQWPARMDERTLQQVIQVHQGLLRQPFEGWIENVPAYASLAVFFDPEKYRGTAADLVAHLTQIAHTAVPLDQSEAAPVRIPVCYDDVFALDLADLAPHQAWIKQAIIALHHAAPYTVYMIGFLPGFAYMGKVHDAIMAPRKPSPRAKVPAGSVGIAGQQTGIYPLEAPGGWQIVGRTPLKMYDPDRMPAFLLKAGDRVQFYPISRTEFEALEPVPAVVAPAADAAVLLAKVLKTGPLTTFQDLGRTGFRAYGVPVGGALDRPAHRCANALVHNPPDAVALECVMGGLVLEWTAKPTLLAATGGGALYLNGAAVAHGQAFTVATGDVLEVKFHPSGLRTYLAVRGGWYAPLQLGGRGASLNAGLGRALQKGDLLGSANLPEIPTVESGWVPLNRSNTTIRVMPGVEFGELDADSQHRMFDQTYILSNRSNRMGLHLEGQPLHLGQPLEMLSSVVTTGTVQRTPNGQLIVLLHDGQTTGGYPRVGQVHPEDLPLLAQMIPNEPLKMVFFSLELV